MNAGYWVSRRWSFPFHLCMLFPLRPSSTYLSTANHVLEQHRVEPKLHFPPAEWRMRFSPIPPSHCRQPPSAQSYFWGSMDTREQSLGSCSRTQGGKDQFYKQCSTSELTYFYKVLKFIRLQLLKRLVILHSGPLRIMRIHSKAHLLDIKDWLHSPQCRQRLAPRCRCEQ